MPGGPFCLEDRIDDFTLARGVHVLAVLMWIGGVAFVTTAAMPAIRHGTPPADRMVAFGRFEQRFAPQARLWVLLAGGSGLWMTWRADLWERFSDPRFWWMHAMAAIWLVFFVMLFVVEPLLLHRRMSASPTPAADFARMERMHRVLLALSLATVVGATLGSHGLY